MLIGEKDTFAVECYHDPLLNEARWVFGRMCLWAGGTPLGDIDEPACMLNVTEGHLQSLLLRLDALEDPAVVVLSDREAFEFLDRAIYLGDARPVEQVVADSARFFKFDLLTNGGESFDRTKSFIVADGECLRLLFEDQHRGFASARVARAAFVLAVRGFLAWVADERKNAG